MNYNSDEASIRETRTGDLRISKTLPYLNWHTKLALIDSLIDYSYEHRAWDYDDLSYKHFLKIMRKYKPLSHKAEISEYEKIKTGDENAYNNFVLSNLRYVLTVARKHQNLGLPLNDLISEGIIGLCKAIKSWDESRGFRFITYAYHFIRAEMLRALSRDSLIHIPNNIFQSIEMVKRVQRKHYMENGCEIGFLELIEKLEIGANFLSPIMQAAEIKVLPLECIRAVSDSFDEFDTALTALTAGPIFSEFTVDEDLFQESLRISVEQVLREGLVSRRKQSIKIEPIPESTIRKATAQLRKGQRLFIRDYKNELKESNKNYKKLYDDEKRRIEFLMTLGYTKFLGDGNNLLDKLEDRFQRHQQKIE